MAFDGITIANLAYEFKSTLEGGKIAKIAQPEKDDLVLCFFLISKYCAIMGESCANGYHLCIFSNGKECGPKSTGTQHPPGRTNAFMANAF